MENLQQEQLKETLKELVAALETQNRHLRTIISLIGSQTGEVEEEEESHESDVGPVQNVEGNGVRLGGFITIRVAVHPTNGDETQNDRSSGGGLIQGQEVAETAIRTRSSRSRRRSQTSSNENSKSDKGRRQFYLYTSPTPGGSRNDPFTTGNATNHWNYWRPRYRNGDVFVGRGLPDYIPEWELFQSDDGKWHHIDDTDLSNPVVYDGPGQSENGVPLYIPYARAPPTREERISPVGLGHMRDQIESALGELYSVPPDGRLSLAFQMNQLRQRCEDETLTTYLAEMTKLLAALRKAGGHLEITDLDDFKGSARYRMRKEKDVWVPKLNDRGGMMPMASMPGGDNFPAGPALVAEE
ncbi:hypothetical protein C8A03DRAFT_33054, partial [Achaetomium macrosporum]